MEYVIKWNDSESWWELFYNEQKPPVYTSSSVDDILRNYALDESDFRDLVIRVIVK
jgi:hypothetical protein